MFTFLLLYLLLLLDAGHSLAKVEKDHNPIEFWDGLSIYKKDHPVTPKQVVNVLEHGYLGVEKDFPEQLSSALPCKKKRNHQ